MTVVLQAILGSIWKDNLLPPQTDNRKKFLAPVPIGIDVTWLGAALGLRKRIESVRDNLTASTLSPRTRLRRHNRRLHVSGQEAMWFVFLSGFLSGFLSTSLWS